MTPTSREAFEKWVRKNTEYDLERRDNGEYTFTGATDAWAGWQAALSTMGDVVAVGELEALRQKWKDEMNDPGWNGHHRNATQACYIQLSAILNRGGK